MDVKRIIVVMKPVQAQALCLTVASLCYPGVVIWFVSEIAGPAIRSGFDIATRLLGCLGLKHDAVLRTF